MGLMRTLPAVGHALPFKAWAAAFAGKDDRVAIPGAGPGEDRMVLTSSGTAALAVAMRGCRMNSGRRKVILPAYTCPSVLAAAGQAGLRAVLCDLAPGRLGLDPERLANLIDDDTLAVVHVHLFGADRGVGEVAALARSRGVLLIEDCAQAFGGCIDGRPTGHHGDVAIFSFGRGKPLSALHGGAVAVNNDALAPGIQEAWRALCKPLPPWFGIYYRVLLSAYAVLFHPRLFGIPTALPWFRIGETVYIEKVAVHPMAGPARRTLIALQRKQGAILRNRARVAHAYSRLLAPYGGHFSFRPASDMLDGGPLRYPLVFKDPLCKSACLKKLTALGLGASGSYPVPLSLQAGVPADVAAQGPFPNASHVARGILTLPTHEHVTERDVTRMVRIIAREVAS